MLGEINYPFPNFNCWGLKFGNGFHSTLYNGFNYLSMLGLKLIHVSKVDPGTLRVRYYASRATRRCQITLREQCIYSNVELWSDINWAVVCAYAFSSAICSFKYQNLSWNLGIVYLIPLEKSENSYIIKLDFNDEFITSKIISRIFTNLVFMNYINIPITI